MWEKIKGFAQVLEVLIDIVKVLVVAVEIPGWGAEKKKAVQDVVSKFLDIVEEHFFTLPVSKQIFLDITGWLIEIYVAFFNKVGEFVRSASATLTDSGIKTK